MAGVEKYCWTLLKGDKFSWQVRGGTSGEPRNEGDETLSSVLLAIAELLTKSANSSSAIFAKGATLLLLTEIDMGSSVETSVKARGSMGFDSSL